MTGKGFLGSLLLVVLMVFPVIPHMPYDVLNTAILACDYLIIALSLVLLIGLVGQISLGQASLVGMGAFVAAIASNDHGVTFPYTLLVGLIAGAAMAALVGVVALRVRGLYLAVATLIFAYVCDQYLFVQPWLVPSQSGTSVLAETLGTQGSFPYFDLSDAHIFYYPSLAIAVACLYALGNIQESRLGRAFAAIRGSEVAASSLGISVMRYKLIGFAIAGGMAGLAGALILAGNQTASPQQFDFATSLYFLAIAVVAGLRSPGGAIGSALLFAVLVGEVFFRFPKVADYLSLVSALLLITVLLFFRGGMGALPERLSTAWAHNRHRLERLATVMRTRLPSRRVSEPGELKATVAAPSLAGPVGRLMAWVRHRATRNAQASNLQSIDVVSLVSRVTAESAEVILLTGKSEARDSKAVRRILTRAAGGDAVAGQPGSDGRREPILLAAENITVKFGGLTAVSDASLTVNAGEIVGLIGPNGAGKTTLFNSILGLNEPTTGSVTLFERDVTKWPVHKRAALGVGRTFQVLQLFGDLTVFDNLLVATHLQNRTGLFGGLFVTGRARSAEHAARARVLAVLRLMDLEQFAERKVAGLPFGVLRLVEVARTLVTGARVVCFDEPASGLDSHETEGLIEWFRLLRQIGITLLVIEHDVDMVVRLCDYIYVLDQGHLLAEGVPSEIQRNPAVIASYLGQMEEAS